MEIITTQTISNIITMLVLVGLGIAVKQMIQNFINRSQQKFDKYIDKIDKTAEIQRNCRLELDRINLGKLKETAEDAYDALATIEEMNQNVSSMKNSVADQKNLLIKYTTQQEGLSDKLKDYNDNTKERVEQIRKSQEEHFTMVENAFTAKVSALLQEHLSDLKEDIREVSGKVDKIELRVSRLEKAKKATFNKAV